MKLYVRFQVGDRGPLTRAIVQVAGLFDLNEVEELVDDDDVEADIAIVDTAGLAQRVMRETEQTKILIFASSTDQIRIGESLAERSSGRVRVTSVDHFTINLSMVMRELLPKGGE